MPSHYILKAWRENPEKFVWDNFQATPDKWQSKALRVFPSQKPNEIRQSLQACAGPGKSTVLTWMGWNFLSCYGDSKHHPKGAAVSTTYQNLMDNLWPEFAKWHNHSEFLKRQFTWNKERISSKEFPETWFMSARSWSKTANAEEQGRTLSGLHSKYVLVLIDESGDIPLSVLRAGEQALADMPLFGKIIQAGNPTSLEGMLHAAATTLSHLWNVIRITGDPDDPDRSPRISKSWARQQIKDFGRDNPWVMSYILGLFPPASINTLLGPDEVRSAMQRHLKDHLYGFSQKRLGVDCARFGDDRTILAPRQGLVAFNMAEMRNARGPEVAARIALAEQRWHHELCFIDDTGGWGASTQDALLQANLNYIPVNFSGKASDPRYFNKRAEMWFKMAEWIKRGSVLPNDPELVRELTAPTYTFKNGKFILEDKRQIKARLGFSPDKADSLALTFAIAEAPSVYRDHVTKILFEKANHVSDYDPFDPSRA